MVGCDRYARAFCAYSAGRVVSVSSAHNGVNNALGGSVRRARVILVYPPLPARKTSHIGVNRVCPRALQHNTLPSTARYNTQNQFMLI